MHNTHETHTHTHTNRHMCSCNHHTHFNKNRYKSLRVRIAVFLFRYMYSSVCEAERTSKCTYGTRFNKDSRKHSYIECANSCVCAPKLVARRHTYPSVCCITLRTCQYTIYTEKKNPYDSLRVQTAAFELQNSRLVARRTLAFAQRSEPHSLRNQYAQRRSHQSPFERLN